jgi:hypothetical protein
LPHSADIRRFGFILSTLTLIKPWHAHEDVGVHWGRRRNTFPSWSCPSEEDGCCLPDDLLGDVQIRSRGPAAVVATMAKIHEEAVVVALEDHECGVMRPPPHGDKSGHARCAGVHQQFEPAVDRSRIERPRSGCCAPAVYDGPGMVRVSCRVAGGRSGGAPSLDRAVRVRAEVVYLSQHPVVRLVVVVDRRGAQDADGLGFRQSPHDVTSHRGVSGAQGDDGVGVRAAKMCLTFPPISPPQVFECSVDDRLPTEVVQTNAALLS